MIEAEAPFGSVVFAVICDGVGGFEQGEYASAVVVKDLCDWFERRAPFCLAKALRGPEVDFQFFRDDLSAELRALNEQILRYGEKNGIDLGTTASIFLGFNGAYLIAHVGDCRIYKLSDSGLDRLTRDQTWVAQQVAKGLLDEVEALHHPRSNVILQAVGAQPDLFPDFSEGAFQVEDVVALCCDGLYRDVPESQLNAALNEMRVANQAEMQGICETLVEMSIENGATDNITLLCFTGSDYSAPASEDESRSGGFHGDAERPEHSFAQPDDGATVIAKDSRTVIVPSGPTASRGGQAR